MGRLSHLIGCDVPPNELDNGMSLKTVPFFMLNEDESAFGMNLEQSSLIQKSPELHTFILVTSVGTICFLLCIWVGKKLFEWIITRTQRMEGSVLTKFLGGRRVSNIIEERKILGKLAWIPDANIVDAESVITSCSDPLCCPGLPNRESGGRYTK